VVFGLQARNSVVELVCCLLYYYLFLLILVPDCKHIQHRPCFVDLIAYNTTVVMSFFERNGCNELRKGYIL